MGMYTEIVVKAGLKENVSKEVCDVIDYMFGTGELPEVLPEHEFFTLPRWYMVGRCSSWYHHPTTVNNIDKQYPDWKIFSRSDLKNYDNEIDTFFDWFRTVIDASEGQCIGYSWYEEESQPVLVLM